MNKIVKFAMLPLLAIVAVLGIIAAYIVATFDPNQYKPQLEQAVKEQLGRTIRLDGDIKLSLFPGVGITLGKVWLSERTGDQEFAGVEDIRIALRLRPLLSKQLVIDAVEIKNLRANVVRTKDGKINIDDLIGGDDTKRGHSVPVVVDVARLELRNATITLIDQVQDAQYVFSKLELETGRLANGSPAKVELSFILQSDKPKLDLKTALNTTIQADLAGRQYTLQGLDLTTQGLAAGISDLMAKAKGNVEARLGRNELSISELTLIASGKQDGRDLNVKVEAPAFKVFGEHVSGEGIALDATLGKRSDQMAATLAIRGVEGTVQAFKVNELTASLDLRQAGVSIKAKTGGPLTGSADAQQFAVSKLALTVRLNNPKLLKQPLNATFNSAVQADFTRRTVTVTFVTRIDASNIIGKAELTKFAPPLYTFDVQIDQLDADKYLPERDPKQVDEPFDLAALKDLNASGILRIGVLTLAGIKASNVRIDVKSADGRLDVSTPVGKGNIPAKRSDRMMRKPRALSAPS